MHKPVKYAEKGLTYIARGGWAVFERLNRIKPNPSFTPKWSEKPLSEVVSEDETATGLAANYRFIVPKVHSGNSPADRRRQTSSRNSAERESRRD